MIKVFWRLTLEGVRKTLNPTFLYKDLHSDFVSEGSINK